LGLYISFLKSKNGKEKKKRGVKNDRSFIIN